MLASRLIEVRGKKSYSQNKEAKEHVGSIFIHMV